MLLRMRLFVQQCFLWQKEIAATIHHGLRGNGYQFPSLMISTF